MRTFALLGREIQVGPRSPMLLWALLVPVLLTVLVRGVFGSLFQPQPRLAVVDEGNSVLVAQLEQLDGIDVTVLTSTDELMRKVEANDFDAGLVLQPGFDAAVQSGAQPTLQLFISERAWPPTGSSWRLPRSTSSGVSRATNHPLTCWWFHSAMKAMTW